MFGKGGRRVNMLQKICTHVSKRKNDTCWNYSRNREKGRWRRMIEEVNSCMIYLPHCKNLHKCYNVPPPKKIKEK
jgi:mannose/cellobiose epimerase-like protein (N-acyl-D-glucosamine 2-epimerase family)